MLSETEITIEVQRLKAQFEGADERKIAALEGLIYQAAYETVFLRVLNKQALETGLVKIHPDNPGIQQTLPIASVISKHSAALTNILDKLCRHLAPGAEEEDDGLAEFE